MPPTIQTSARPSVTIGAMRSVVIGRGDHRVTFQSPPTAQWTGPTRRVAVEAKPRQVVIGGRQGIAGPPGPEGTGVSHLEPRIADLESRAALTGALNW